MANQKESQEKQTSFQESQQLLDEEQLQEVTGGGNVAEKMVSCCDTSTNFTDPPRPASNNPPQLVRELLLHTQDGTLVGSYKIYNEGPLSSEQTKAGVKIAKEYIHNELGLRYS